MSGAPKCHLAVVIGPAGGSKGRWGGMRLTDVARANWGARHAELNLLAEVFSEPKIYWDR